MTEPNDNSGLYLVLWLIFAIAVVVALVATSLYGARLEVEEGMTRAARLEPVGRVTLFPATEAGPRRTPGGQLPRPLARPPCTAIRRHVKRAG